MAKSQPVGKIIFPVQPWMLEWIKVRDCGSVLGWLLGLVRNERIAMRMIQKLDRATFCKGEPAAPKSNDNDFHKTVLNPEAVQRILFLRESEGLGTMALAKRFRCGVSQIKRILADRDDSSSRSSRDASKITFGSAQGQT